MKFTITFPDATRMHGDTSAGQEFSIESNGVLTFFDAPEDDKRSVTAYAPSAWIKVSYVDESGTGEGSGRTGFVS